MGGLRARLRRWSERRAELVGINRRNVELVYPNNRRADYPLADDKLRTKALLVESGIPVPETLVECHGLHAIGRTLEALEGVGDFVVKPASGSGGDGILVVDAALGRRGWRRPDGRLLSRAHLEKHLADIVFGAYTRQLDDRAYAERRIHPDPAFASIWSEGLSDVRVLTLDGRPFLAMVRVPTRASEGRANLHQGGIGLAVDLATGEVRRARMGGAPVLRHPDSGAPLCGWRLPRWEETLEVASRAARGAPLGYLGVDLVLDRDRGPLVLELNARPGLEIQNVHGLGIGGLLGSVRP